MKKELEKVYDPARVEDKTYQFWEEGGYFHAEVEPDKTPYTIVIPPPNITGKLHMGHALDETLQDILIRWRRMRYGCLERIMLPLQRRQKLWKPCARKGSPKKKLAGKNSWNGPGSGKKLTGAIL